MLNKLKNDLKKIGWDTEIEEGKLMRIKIIAERNLPYGEYKRKKTWGILTANGEYDVENKTMPVKLTAGEMVDAKENLEKNLQTAYTEAEGMDGEKALMYVLKKFAIGITTIRDYKI